MDAAEPGRKDIVKWQLNSSLANNDDVGEDFLITRRLAYLQGDMPIWRFLGTPFSSLSFFDEALSFSVAQRLMMMTDALQTIQEDVVYIRVK